MLIKFTSGGRGGGAAVCSYLVDAERQGREHCPPEVVRGDLARTQELIDSIGRQWTYTHGVLSFAPEDAPTVIEQEAAMDAFEAFAFAGLDVDQFDISWVRHQHTEGGRVELHFVTPRMELASGRALNIAPPGWERSFSTLRDALNLEHGWARPDDPARAREVAFELSPSWAQHGFHLKEGKEAVHGYVAALIERGAVHDRVSLVDALTEAGLEVTRAGKDYVTVRDPDTDERLRLRGRIYEKDWNDDAELGRAAAREVGEPDGRDRGLDRERAAEALAACEREREHRADRNRDRYRPSHAWDQERAATAEMDLGADLGRADRELDADRLLALALEPALEGGGGHALGDVPERGAELPGGARERDPAAMHHALGAESDLPAYEEWGLSHGPAHGIGARLARTVQALGERVRSIGERVRGIFEEGGRMVAAHLAATISDRGPLVADRGHTAALERGLGELERGLSQADRLNHALGAAGERVAERTLTLVQERKAHEWELERAARRERDRGHDHEL